MTVLLVAEKPKVAKRIADALGNYQTEKNRGVKNYVLDTEIGEVIVAPAVGHLFTLEQKDGKWEYPVFDVEWVPSHTTKGGGDYMKKYFQNLRDQGKKADAYINGCDYDVEGSVIGYNVIHLACDGAATDIQRMHFSTLTSGDLRDAFDGLEGFDKGQTEAGLTRHVLDWYYGINMSRALMLAVRSQDRYKTLSTGRVQGPALKLLADREREIKAFEPDPYWEIAWRGGGLEAWHENGKFWEEEQADAVMGTCNGHDGVVHALNRRRYKHNPPTPFNLTDLQREAQSMFRISPKQTQQLAQSLYENSLISYPRTESQKLPAKIGYKPILEKLKKQDDYTEGAQKVLDKKDMSPRQGKKSDAAHPAIYPTGLKPSGLNKKEKKVYDLIVKRFLATFGDPAVRESLKITLDVNGEMFNAKGKRTVEPNWFTLYQPYVRVKEIELPDVEKGQTIPVDELEKLDKETQPPKRYTQSSLITELEKKGLGTKATRANIIDSLYNRKYITGQSIEVTDLGLAVIEALEEYSPTIISEELTRQFEQEMEQIRGENRSPDQVLDTAKKTLNEVLGQFKEHEEAIGESLINAVDKTRKKERQLGPCAKCDDGMLRVIKTKKGSRFAGCSNYPDCDNSFPLPRNGKIESEDELCNECGTPKIKVIRKGKRPFTMCIDPDCSTKDDWGN